VKIKRRFLKRDEFANPYRATRSRALKRTGRTRARRSRTARGRSPNAKRVSYLTEIVRLGMAAPRNAAGLRIGRLSRRRRLLPAPALALHLVLRRAPANRITLRSVAARVFAFTLTWISRPTWVWASGRPSARSGSSSRATAAVCTRPAGTGKPSDRIKHDALLGERGERSTRISTHHFRRRQLDVFVLQYVQYRSDVVRHGRLQTVQLLGQPVHTMMHVGVSAALRAWRHGTLRRRRRYHSRVIGHRGHCGRPVERFSFRFGEKRGKTPSSSSTGRRGLVKRGCSSGEIGYLLDVAG